MILNQESFSKIKSKLTFFIKHRNLAIFLALISLIILVGVIYLSYYQVEFYTDTITSDSKKSVKKNGTPTQTATPTKNVTIISPTVFIVTPTLIPTSTPTPVATNTPVPTSVIAPTSTPVPNDTTPPTIHSMTGPENGSTVDFNSFCFPIHVSDDRSSGSQLNSQYKFDSDSWTDWGSNMSPCFSNVSNGEHRFVIHVKDSAGNVSAESSSTFKVEVN